MEVEAEVEAGAEAEAEAEAAWNLNYLFFERVGFRLSLTKLLVLGISARLGVVCFALPVNLT